MSHCTHSHTILFQGDSITDAGRVYDDPSSLGGGYPMFVASWYAAMFPEENVEFINRGISGNRAIDLVNRWDKDCIDLNPDVVSILIGINDTWRAFDSNDPTSTEEFEKNYRTILARTTEETDARIIIMEPFVLPYPEDRLTWRADLDPKIQVARNLAREFDATLITLDALFAQAATKRDPDFWAADGVHPSAAGHAFIAQQWLEALGSACG